MSRSQLAIFTRPRGAVVQVPGRLLGAAVLGAFAYPVILVSSFYLTWFTAWIALGHAPRPMLDDPKYIVWWVDIPYGVTMGLLIGAPGAAVLGLFMAPLEGVRRSAPGWQRLGIGLAALVGLALLWGAALWILRADPWEVGTWFMD